VAWVRGTRRLGAAAPLNRPRGLPGVRARGREAAWHGRRVGLAPRLSRDARSGAGKVMTGGPHPSAAGGGCVRGRASGPRWAVGRAGLRCWCWAVVAAGPKRRGLKGRVFTFQTHSNNEFKPEFEVKHNKMTHQHVCNRELLNFIIELRKIVKCL
jgi:hypothetical protein